MIKERYCSMEVAKLLKEKGFDEPCRTIYDEKTLHNTICNFLNSELSYYVCAPTHQVAMDWLREKGYHIEIYANASGYRFIISKTPPDGTDLVCNIEGNNDGGAWDDYGECVEDAIKHCLIKLIKL